MSGDLNRDHEEAFGAQESAEGSRQLIFAIINQALWDATRPQWQRAQDAIFFFFGGNVRIYVELLGLDYERFLRELIEEMDSDRRQERAPDPRAETNLPGPLRALALRADRSFLLGAEMNKTTEALNQAGEALNRVINDWVSLDDLPFEDGEMPALDCARKSLAAVREALTEPVCQTCNGLGVIGGFVNMDSGYQDDPCPDCVEPVKQEPVAFVSDVHLSRYTLEWNGQPLPEGTKLYAAPVQPVKQDPVTTDLMDMLRLIETIKYLRGIAERGLGREIGENETIEQFVLGYVKQLESTQPVKQEPVAWHHPECKGECIACLIERCVKDSYGTQGLDFMLRHINAAPVDAKAIRSEALEEAEEIAKTIGGSFSVEFLAAIRGLK